MKKANVNGVELEYQVTGSGEPLLLINPVLADGFSPLVSESVLSERYQLIAYHKRGWLGSTHTAAPVSIADHAADAAALLDHLGVVRAHVAGHSSGAAIALQLALDRPSVVQTLVLLEPSLLWLESAQQLLAKAAPAFEAYGAADHEAAVAIFLSVVSGLEWDACRSLLEQRSPGSVARAIADADTLFGVELPALSAWTFEVDQAAAISCPVLSILGANTEPLWLEVAQQLRAWFPRVEECTIAAAGHLLHLQRPKAVAEAIAGFLARHRMSAGSRPAVHELRHAAPDAGTSRQIAGG